MIYIISLGDRQIIFGLSTDVKPLQCLPNSTFHEEDTGKIYQYITNIWIDKTAMPSFPTGQGASITQVTNKSTGVTINTLTGQITMSNVALAAAAEVNFVVTNSKCSTNDLILVNHKSGGTFGAYMVNGGFSVNGTFRIMVGNMSAGSLSEAIVLQFCIIKGVVS